jgi:hypothetical protein
MRTIKRDKMIRENCYICNSGWTSKGIANLPFNTTVAMDIPLCKNHIEKVIEELQKKKTDEKEL